MAEPLLAISGLAAGYGATEVLRDIDLAVIPGEIVAILGANGAGKSTLNRTISGVLRATRGTIQFAGSAIERETPAAIVGRGLIHVPEGRCVFPNLTVAENLDLGGYRRGRARRNQNRERVFAIFPRMSVAENLQMGADATECSEAERSSGLERVFALFPRLKERFPQQARTMSGGEQQMLAIGRALMAKPRVLLLDEPTEGLAPIYVKLLFDLIVNLRASGLTVMIVEQNVHHVLRTADRAYVLENGRIVMEGEGAALLNDDRLKTAYLGL